jgi:hypothetical protein
MVALTGAFTGISKNRGNAEPRPVGLDGPAVPQSMPEYNNGVKWFDRKVRFLFVPDVKCIEQPIDVGLLSEVQEILRPIQNQTWPSGFPQNN